MNTALAAGGLLYPTNEDPQVFRRFTEKLKTLVRARSVRLLTEPSLLIYRGNSLIAADSRTEWRIQKVENLKRYSQRVMDHILHRDYYKVETDMHELLCVYYCNLEKRFYLHGYFD